MKIEDLCKKNKIGFVILVWNSEAVIRACLSSIFSIKEIEPHVVIVDNGSTDRTLEIVKSFSPSEGSSLEVIHYDENKGTTKSRNDGIVRLQKRTPDYYCILDSDTVINGSAVKWLIKEMESNDQYGMIGPKMITSRGTVQTSARSFPTLIEKLYKGMPIASLQRRGEQMELQLPEKHDSASYTVDYLMSACWLIRPEALEKTGLLDEKIFYAPEDAEYCIQMWKSGYQVAYCPKAQIIHEWQRLSKKKLISKMNWEHIKGLAYMFNKHRYMFTTKRLKKAFPKST